MSTTFGCLTQRCDARLVEQHVDERPSGVARFSWTSLTTTSFSKPAGPRWSASWTSAIPPWPIWVISS